MKTLNKLLAYKIDTIAIVGNTGDDGPERMRLSWQAGVAGFKTIAFLKAYNLSLI